MSVKNKIIDQETKISGIFKEKKGFGYLIAKCPICSTNNILADEADVCEHFNILDEDFKFVFSK